MATDTFHGSLCTRMMALRWNGEDGTARSLTLIKVVTFSAKRCANFRSHSNFFMFVSPTIRQLVVCTKEAHLRSPLDTQYPFVVHAWIEAQICGRIGDSSMCGASAKSFQSRNGIWSPSEWARAHYPFGRTTKRRGHNNHNNRLRKWQLGSFWCGYVRPPTHYTFQDKYVNGMLSVLFGIRRMGRDARRFTHFFFLLRLNGPSHFW